jgi:hypothetical protein
VATGLHVAASFRRNQTNHDTRQYWPEGFRCSSNRVHLPGNLLPFAWNFWPNSFSLPPPAEFSWHCPQGKPVCCANTGVAAAFRAKTINVVAAIIVAIATAEALAMLSNVMFRISITPIDLRTGAD